MGVEFRGQSCLNRVVRRGYVFTTLDETFLESEPIKVRSFRPVFVCVFFLFFFISLLKGLIIPNLPRLSRERIEGRGKEKTQE